VAVSIRKNGDLEKCVDEVATAQIAIVGNDDVVVVVSLVLRAMKHWSAFRAKFGNEDLSWLTDRMCPFVPDPDFENCRKLSKHPDLPMEE
jgi:hypothetical protein